MNDNLSGNHDLINGRAGVVMFHAVLFFIAPIHGSSPQAAPEEAFLQLLQRCAKSMLAASSKASDGFRLGACVLRSGPQSYQLSVDS